MTATTEALSRVGYAQLRIDDVAQAAHCGLGALYRRWPTKRALVLAALTTLAPDSDIPETDNPGADVARGLEQMAAGLSGPMARLLSGLLTEMQDDAELAEAVRSAVIGPLRDGHKQRMGRLLGDLSDLEERADIAPAFLIFRSLVVGQPVPPEKIHLLLPTLIG
jgi:AcrR family transcriptional regulator